MRAKRHSPTEIKLDAIRHNAIAGNTDTYVKDHKKTINYIKFYWFKQAAYRYTSAECGGTNLE